MKTFHEWLPGRVQAEGLWLNDKLAVPGLSNVSPLNKGVKLKTPKPVTPKPSKPFRPTPTATFKAKPFTPLKPLRP